MAETNEKTYPIENFGGIQRTTSRFLQKDGDANVAENTSFDNPGAFGKLPGYTQQGNDLTSTTTTSTSSSTTTTSTSTSSSTSSSTSTTTTA